MAKPNSFLACCRALVVALLATSLSASADIPVKWTTDTFKVKPLVYECYHGETLDLESSLTSYGEPLALSGETARLYWQTNGMGSAWWTTNAAVRVDADTGATNILAATFSGAFDTGAKSVTGFIGIEGKNYRAAFQLNFRDSPGFAPNALPIPPQKIDWANVANANVDAAPFVVKGGAGGMTPTQVTNISTFVASSATVTNAGAVAAAQAMKKNISDVVNDEGETVTGNDIDSGYGGVSIAESFYILSMAINDKADASTTLSGYGITDAYTKTDADGKFLVTKPDDSHEISWSSGSLTIGAANVSFGSSYVSFGAGVTLPAPSNISLNYRYTTLDSYLASTEWHGTNKSLTDYGITNTIPSKPTIETYAINAVSNSDNLWTASNAKLTATIDGEMTNRNSSAWTGISGSVIERIRTIETNVGTANAALEAILGGN